MTPTHYTVLYDDTDKDADHLVNLAYRLCYLYYNWSGTIRVPAPVKLAHKLAYFLGEIGVGKGSKVAVHEIYKRLKG